MKANKKKKIDYKKVISTWLKHNYIYIIMVALVGLRVLLGYGLGGWFGVSEVYDDVAMMKGLDIRRITSPDHLALIKDLSYSLFLGFNAIINLPYTVTLALFWALTALVVWLLVRKVSKNKWVQLFAFTYVLFLPIAFTPWGGLRIYRNAVIAPSIILTFSLLLMLLVDLFRDKKSKKTIWMALFAGISFAYTYYLKEDGIWMMACLAVIILVCVIAIVKKFLRKDKKKAFAWSLICLIPFGVWFVWTNVYKGFDYAVYGVYETNTRTKGELGKFVENIYKIDSPNRTAIVWAPYDAIQKAFEVSPTLKAQSKLLDEIMNTGWNKGGIIKNPIKYDFLGWVLRSELVDAGLWTSEKAVSDMFKQVNNELSDAFKDGTLKKAEGRIQLLASTGGYTIEEVLKSNIFEQMYESFLDTFWLKRYGVGFGTKEIEYGTKLLTEEILINNYSKANKVLHMNNNLNVIEGRDIAKGAAEVVCVIYRIVNTGVLVVFVVFTFGEIVIIIRKRKTLKSYCGKATVEISCFVVSVMFLGVALAYSFATAWFFIGEPHDMGAEPTVFVFYRVGVPALYALAVLPAIVGISQWNLMSKKKKR